MPFFHDTGTKWRRLTLKTDYAQDRTANLYPVSKQKRVDQLISLQSSKISKVMQASDKDKQHGRQRENSLNSGSLFGTLLFALKHEDFANRSIICHTFSLLKFTCIYA